MKKSHKNVNFCDKKSQTSGKSLKTVDLCDKKLQYSKNSHKTVNLISQTYGINCTTRQKLLNLDYLINKVIVKITKRVYLD